MPDHDENSGRPNANRSLPPEQHNPNESDKRSFDAASAPEDRDPSSVQGGQGSQPEESARADKEEIVLDDSPKVKGTEPLSPFTLEEREEIRRKLDTAKLVSKEDRPDTSPTTSRGPLSILSPFLKYDPKNPETAVLHGKSPARRPNLIDPDTPIELIQTSEQREIILVIRGMVERLVMREHKPVVLGRTDIKTRTMPDVDLTPYGALDRGVSREHCSLYIEGDKIFVVDMNSTNGTWLATERLIPNKPRQLRKGEELLLGRLPVQVLFR